MLAVLVSRWPFRYTAATVSSPSNTSSAYEYVNTDAFTMNVLAYVQLSYAIHAIVPLMPSLVPK